MSCGVPRRRASCEVVARRSKRRKSIFPVVETRRLTFERPNVPRERQVHASSFVQHVLAQAGPTILHDVTKIPGTPKLDSQKVPEALIQLWVSRAIAEFGIGTAKLTAYAVNTLSDESELGKQVRSLGEVPKAELIEAQEREIDGLFKKKNAFEIVPFKERDRSAPILQHVWVHKVRSDDTVKSRLCIGGHRQKHGHSYWETSSPAPRPTSIRIALGIAAQNGWEPRTSDVAQAYIAGKPRSPHVHETSGRVQRLPEEKRRQSFRRFPPEGS